MPIDKLSIEDQNLWTIGMLVVTMQTTERLINMCLRFAFPEGGVNTIETLTKAEESYRKATLGRLVELMKKRVDLDEDFDQVLAAFVLDRNTLIHDLNRAGGFDRSSPESMQKISSFLSNLVENMNLVTRVFVSLLYEWSKETGVHTDDFPDVTPVIGDFEGIARRVFFAKKDG
ncbi:hypothetical protein [Rhizobium sp. AU243]|uniref:hypothetical protein n=1 Tax=Rhizobium sp. AU243 TaxID=2303425 RepID=UPI0010CB1149|nr:hypothetical protein [Rhizobium sp. AU243]TKV76739.1 hypothetical protein D0C28_14315 [Rhizobium sp. AU243]